MRAPGVDDPAEADLSAGQHHSVRTAAARIPAAVALVAGAAPVAFTLYAAVTLASSSFPVVIAWLTKLIIDGLAADDPAATLVALTIALAGVGVATGLTPYLIQYLQGHLDRQVGLLVQDRLFTAVDDFIGLRRFENPNFLDRLRLSQRPAGVSPHAVQSVDGSLGMISAGVTITGFLGSLFVLSPLMTGLVLAAGVPALVAHIALARQHASMAWQLGPTERRELFYAGLLSSVEAAKEIRLFGAGAFLRERMLADRRTANSTRRATDRREVLVQSALSVLAALVAGGGLLWAVTAARAGSLTPGDITIFVAAVAGVQAQLAALAGDLARAHEALLMLGHYVTLVNAGPDLPTETAPRPLPALRQGIRFRNVWFRYSDEHPWILRGVDLYLPHGHVVALVGLNGAGKSTLVKLLCRFYDPTTGTITWDGTDIRRIDVHQLRRRVSGVFQDYMTYDMTAAENIALGDLDARHDVARIQEAAQYAGIHEQLMELPHGYDTLLSRTFFMEADKHDPHTGVVLSGGQGQRLSLARAFLRDRRDLMILDEPSAGLDAAAEYEIHNALRQHRAGRTSLLITHRLAPVREADLIVVLSNGRIVEKGDHSALMAAGGEYARLFTLQATGYQFDAEQMQTDQEVQ